MYLFSKAEFRGKAYMEDIHRNCDNVMEERGWVLPSLNNQGLSPLDDNGLNRS